MKNDLKASVDTTAQVGMTNTVSRYDIGDAKTAGVLTTNETTADTQVQGNAYKLEQIFTPSTSLIASMFAGGLLVVLGQLTIRNKK